MAPGHEKIKQKSLFLAEICGRMVGSSLRDMRKTSIRVYYQQRFVADWHVFPSLTCKRILHNLNFDQNLWQEEGYMLN